MKQPISSALSSEEPKIPRFLTAWRFDLLAAILSLGLWWYADPNAYYYGAAPVFSFDSDFLRSHVCKAGGIAEYVGAFIGQLSHSPGWGAPAFALLFCGICAGARTLLMGACRQPGLLSVLPAWALTIVYARYAGAALELMIALFLLYGALALLPKSTRTPLHRIATLLFLSFVLFYLAGPISSLLFVSTAFLFELHCGRHRGVLLTCGSLILAWLSAVHTWGWDTTNLAKRLDNQFDIVLTSIAFLLIPAAWIALFAGHQLDLRRSRASHPTVRSKRILCLPIAGIGLAQVAMAIAVGLFTLWCFDGQKRLRLKIRSEGREMNWAKVLAAASQLREFTPAARLDLVRALFYSGRLNSDLFSFPQRAGVDLLPSLDDGLEVCAPLSDTLLELGQINLAERYSHEALEVQGERPELLWQLAFINMIKGRPRAAVVFLNRLADIPFCQQLAQRWLKAIRQNPSLTNEILVMKARARQVTEDQVERRFSTELLLQQLLRPNQTNFMAAEYLMAHLLLSRQAEQIPQYLSRLAGGERMPRHLAEAVLTLRESEVQFLLCRSNLLSNPETQLRFDRFKGSLAQVNRLQIRPELALRDQFGDTFWYYDLFGRSAPNRSWPGYR